MTLTKEKPKRRTPTDRKRSGQHHRHSQHYMKAYWPYLPIFAVLVAGIILNSWIGHMNRSVLGYATDMSISSLLTDTNQQRADNGERALHLNSKLDQAAQAKANDMAARDYWSHDTPDGKTPWTFITAAGYSYETAGENLAYGFDTAADTLTGWMNSPEHRANILNTTYVDVGFGIINIPDYQNSGPETLVVAMYASPAVPSVIAAIPKPVAKAPVQSPVIATTVPSKKAAPKRPKATAPAKSDTLQPKSKPTTQTFQEPAQKPIARIQLVGNPQAASWGMFATSMITVAALALFMLRHGLAWHKVLVKGERFVLKNPLFDIGFIMLATAGLLLLQTSGVIR